MGDQIHAQAVALENKFPIAAREAYFRAATYYRHAPDFLIGNQTDPRLFSSWDSTLADFDKAISLLDYPVTRYNISTPDFDVPIVVYKASHGNESCPTVVAGNGYDGAQEELFHELGHAVLARGWNFVTYEGPGQPTVRRNQGLGFMPNW